MGAFWRGSCNDGGVVVVVMLTVVVVMGVDAGVGSGGYGETGEKREACRAELGRDRRSGSEFALCRVVKVAGEGV